MHCHALCRGLSSVARYDARRPNREADRLFRTVVVCDDGDDALWDLMIPPPYSIAIYIRGPAELRPPAGGRVDPRARHAASARPELVGSRVALLKVYTAKISTVE